MTSNIHIYLSEGRRFYIAAAAILALNIIFMLTFVLPVRSKVENLKNEYTSLRKERKQKRIELKNTADAAAALDSMKEDLVSFVNSLPDNVNMSGIVREFHGLAKKTALSISSARYSPPVKEGNYLMRYDVSFPVSGRYKNIRKFIYGLEKMPYLMSIDDLALTSKDERNVSVTIKISLYLRAEV